MEANMNSSDKFGLIIQCRQSMDEIPANELKSFAKATMDRFSTNQLKAFLFTGLYGIKKDMEYNQVFTINSDMNEIVRKLKKQQQNKNDNKDDVAATPLPLTHAIPHQVLSNVVCPFLMMPEIMQLAKVSRAMCVIAHIPASISNLCIRYDSYRYEFNVYDYNLDGVFDFSGSLRRFCNVQKLAFCSDMEVDKLRNLPLQSVQHLSLYAGQNYLETQALPILPSLKSITFETSCNYNEILSFLSRYEVEPMATDEQNSTKLNNKKQEKEQTCFKSVIHRLESIAFVNCELGTRSFDSVESLSGLWKFVLPPQPNNLKVLKFEASRLVPPIAQAALVDQLSTEFFALDKIKISLVHLEGFVYSVLCRETDIDQFYKLSLRILRNSQLFTNLRSIHVHDPTMITEDLTHAANRSILPLQSINEFCTTVSSEMLENNGIVRSLGRICCGAKKCCLVYEMKPDYAAAVHDHSKLSNLCQKILQSKTLSLFQLVLIVKDDALPEGESAECAVKYQQVVEFGRHLVDALRSISASKYSSNLAKRALVFKLHIKSIHQAVDAECRREKNNEFRAMVTDVIMNYFLSFPKGNVQIKVSDNHRSYYSALLRELKSLQRLLDVSIKSKQNLNHLEKRTGTKKKMCYEAHDYAFFAVSATAKRVGFRDLKCYDKRWNVDCHYCCNTPWV